MDEKAFISIEYIFSLFIILIVASCMLFYTEATINSSSNIEEDITHRLILDDVRNQISEVNSNGPGYSKYLELPSDKGYFEMTVDESKLTIEYDDKKGETQLPLIKIDSKYKLVSGREYCISKGDDGKIVIA